MLEELASGTKLKPQEVKALYARFRRLAPSGYLLPDKFKQTMGVMGLTDDNFIAERLFQVFDADKDGKLNFLEFASSLAVMIRGTEDEKLALSFHMLAGREGKGVRMADFLSLVAACNTMMSSLVAPTGRLLSPEDAKRLFNDLASVESDGEAVITLDAYKAAAQTSDEFLACLGLEPMLNRSANRKPTRQLMAPVSLPQDSVVISQSQLQELMQRVAALQKAATGEFRRSSSQLSWLSSAPASPAMGSPQRIQEDESWWIPVCGCNPATKVPGLPCAEAHGDGEVLNRGPATPAAAAALGTSGFGLGGMTESTHSQELALQQELCKELDVIAELCSKLSKGGGNSASPNLAPALAEALRHHSGSASRSATRELSRDTEDSRIFASRPMNMHSPGGARKPPSASLDAAAMGNSRDAEGMQGRAKKVLASSRQRRRHRLLGPKKGLAVHFGHENWNMVLSMMIGIRMSVGRSKHELAREIQPVDFIMKEKFSILPRMANMLDATVSKHVTVTRFVDYAPMVFQRIRSSFGIQSEDYLRSVGPEQLLGNMVLGNLSSLSELSSEGKSGAFFYYTSDGKYMMKTVTHKEQQLLKKMLKRYFDYIMQNPSTLLVRFLGLHCLSCRKDNNRAASDKIYFVVMGNMFNTPFEIHRRYDLKGSWVGRVTKSEHFDPSVALKDVDFTEANESIRVGEERRAKLIAQIERDSGFLQDQNIIDYSLLLGIYELGAGSHEAADSDEAKGNMEAPTGEESVAWERPLPPTSRSGFSVGFMKEGYEDDDAALATAQRVVAATVTERTAGSAEAPMHQSDLGGMLSSDKKALYFLGIIDILTPYDSIKHMEHWCKAIRYPKDRRGVSCCPPAMYAQRFNDFMKSAVV